MEWLQQNWMSVSVVYLLFYSFVKGLRDVLDKTPATDDNIFEKAVTALGKLALLFTTGKRPDAK